MRKVKQTARVLSTSEKSRQLSNWTRASIRLALGTDIDLNRLVYSMIGN